VDVTVDLRSDTVTRPTAAMRAAMAEAAVGDDVYGEDPTVTALEERVADLLGKQAGLFTPTGSLANQLGLRLHVGPGQELVCDAQAHVVRAELGAAATFSAITTRTWDAPRGLLDPEVVRAFVRPDQGPYLVSTAAIAVENTHNFGGGTVQPLASLQAVRALAEESGLGVHLDGARLWNAHVASGVPLRAYGATADTVSLCLSKGLGAPVGSVLVGDSGPIAEARVWRKRYGAGMRQVGILAAAGLYALDHHVERLAADHARAQRLAFAIAEAVDAVIEPEHVETNIVVLDLAPTSWTAARLASAAKERGVLISALGPTFARLVTHLDVDDEAIAHASTVLSTLLRTAA
jgi:threonine aldolase